MKKDTLKNLFAGVSAAMLATQAFAVATEGKAEAKLPAAETRSVEEAILTQAPNVPPPIARRYPAKVIVNLEVREVTKRLADFFDRNIRVVSAPLSAPLFDAQTTRGSTSRRGALVR